MYEPLMGTCFFEICKIFQLSRLCSSRGEKRSNRNQEIGIVFPEFVGSKSTR
jgi:hypothetical protein